MPRHGDSAQALHSRERGACGAGRLPVLILVELGCSSSCVEKGALFHSAAALLPVSDLQLLVELGFSMVEFIQ